MRFDSIVLHAEFFNILNHSNFASPNTTVFSGTAFNASGLITSTANTPRQIQFTLKLMF